MKELLQRIFKVDHFVSQAERERAYLIYSLATLIGILTVVVALIAPFVDVGTAQFGAESNLVSTIATFVLVLASIGTVILVRQRQATLGSIILIAMIYLRLLIAALDGHVDGFEYIAVAILVLMGALLLDMRLFWVSSFATLGLFVFSEYIEITTDANSQIVPVVEIVAFVAVIGVAYMFKRFMDVSRQEGVTSEGEERFKLAEINSQITQQASARASLDEALYRTLDLILENYPQFYHAQVFLIDEEGIQAMLRASTGELGQQLLARGHSLAVGSLSVIGQTTLKGDPVIAQARAENTVHRENPLLMQTKLEAAFPLRVAGNIIGALDLQSRDAIRLTDSDIYTFQSLANSLALAIDSIRQFQAAQTRIEENQRLAEQTRSALREVERLNQRLIGRAWSEYLSTRGNQIGLNIDIDTEERVQATRWTSTLADAAQSNHVVQEGRVVAIPLRVRGQVIGAMEFELDQDGQFSPEDFELLQEVSERFGLAAENTRLLEESQRIAQRETLINEISSRLQGANTIESTLAEAARSLTETLQAGKVIIRLGMPDEENGRK